MQINSIAQLQAGNIKFDHPARVQNWATKQI